MFIDGSKGQQKTTNARPEVCGLQTGRRNGQQTGCNKRERRPKVEREGETEVEEIGGRLAADKHENGKIIVGSKQDLQKEETESH